MSRSLAEGTQIGAYQVDGLLAMGGMGVVYRARHIGLDRPVALKLVRAEWAYEDDFRERFKREARLAARLDDPHVVSPYDFGEHDGQLFIVMPLIDGVDLGAIIERDGPLAPARAADVVTQVAQGLDSAHAAGLIHRDVKPQNILLTLKQGRERALITDFGVARALTSDTRLTRTAQLPGSPGFVAPEQINGEPVDARTDVYALGCVLCEALTGTVPYPRPTPAAMLLAHLTDHPPKLSERTAGLPVAFDDVVQRALAKEPAERFASAGDLGEAALEAAERAATPPVPFSPPQTATVGKPAAPAPVQQAAPSAPAVQPASPAVPPVEEPPSAASAGAAPAAPSRDRQARATTPARDVEGRPPVLPRPAREAAYLLVGGLAGVALGSLAWRVIVLSVDYPLNVILAFAALGALIAGSLAAARVLLVREPASITLRRVVAGAVLGAAGGWSSELVDWPSREVAGLVWFALIGAGAGIAAAPRLQRRAVVLCGAVGAVVGAGAGAVVPPEVATFDAAALPAGLTVAGAVLSVWVVRRVFS